MKMKFITNDYLLTWNLLFGASISEETYRFKQKLWSTYKHQYNAMEKDKKELLRDIKNFIPDDDTLYNCIFQTSIFEQIKKETEKHRLDLLKIYDDHKKDLTKSLTEILRFPIEEEYSIIALHPTMESILILPEATNVGWGQREDLKDPVHTLTEMIYRILKNKLSSYQRDYREIVQAVLELAVKNELYTRLAKKSNYLEGDQTLKFLKRQIYPYWIMYLGAGQEEFTKYMMRDKIAFEVDQYTIEPHLKQVDLLGFIDFCITNQRYIIRINHLEII